MLRIGPQGQMPMAGGAPPGPPAPPQGAMLPPPPLQGGDKGPDGGSVMDVGKVKPDIAGYMGSEFGPFECERCIHFSPKDSSCEIVSGKIDPEGCCNLFEMNPDMKGKDPDKDGEGIGEADQGGLDPQALLAALGGGGAGGQG